jgi:hypothetical protein
LDRQEIIMRKTILMLAAASAVAFAAAPASAQPRSHSNYVAPVAGAAVGTAAGVGIYNGWFGSTVGGSALPTTVAGAAAGGFIAGVGTAALIHAATTPCTGFHGLFGGITSSEGCVNGQWVGYQEAPRRGYR